MELNDFQNDRYGNTFRRISEHDCYSCSLEQYISWGGPSGSGYLDWPYGTNIQMFADGIDDLFVFGTISVSNAVIFGTSFSSGQKVLVKSGNTSWAMATNANSVAVNDSGYCFMLRGDSIKLYSPDGLLLWARAGGGSQIFANNNLSYIVGTASGITKYRKNGTIDWQSSVTGSFRVTPHHHIVVKQGGTVYELSTITGQLESVHAGAVQGSIWDNDGNTYTYSGNTLTKHDSSGVAWTTHLIGTVFKYVGLDMYNNIYFANNYLSHTQNSYGEWTNPPIQLFIPPTLFIDPPPLDGSNWGYYAAYSGRINQQNKLNVKLTTGDIKAVCKKSTTLVPFTVSQFQVGFEDGFRAELSDASGSFDNPAVIGTGLISPISANTPFFNMSGNKYKIRVVANNPEVTGKPTKITQFAYPPEGKISVSQVFFPYSGSNEPRCCAPAVLIASPGNYVYQWYKKTYGINGYQSVYNYNDTLIVSSSSGDGYKVIITDTATGCPSTGYKSYFYTYYGVARPDFYLPDSVPLNNGAVDLSSGFGGGFTGTGVSGNKFYPDSAGTGLHNVQWHTSDPATCFSTADTSKSIYVRSNMKQIAPVHITPVKNNYCAYDTVVVSFSYDSALFNAGNIFKVQLGTLDNYGNFNIIFYNLGTGTSSPITCEMPSVYFSPYGMTLYRLRVISTSPYFKGAYNYEGGFTIAGPDDAALTVDGSSTDCGVVFSVISLANGSLNSPVYYWHHNNQVIVDSVIPGAEGYLSIPFTSGSSFIVTEPGDYSVEIVNQFGCKAFSDTIHVAPSATITPQGPTTFCAGDSVVLSANTGTGQTYLWKRYNVNIPGATNADYTATQEGTYKVRITDSFGCSETSDTINVSVPCRKSLTGAENTDAFNVVVFPNPSNGDFIFEFSGPGSENIEIKILDIVGKTILTERVNGLDYTIKSRQLNAGIYSAVITEGADQKVIKLVKANF